MLGGRWILQRVLGVDLAERRFSVDLEARLLVSLMEHPGVFMRL